MELESIFIKLIAGFVGLWAMTMLLGKKEIAALTPFDFISAVMLGDLVGNTIYEKGTSVWMLIFTLAVWIVLSVTFEKITQRYQKLRMMLRAKDTFSVSEVAYAEVNEEGEIYVISHMQDEYRK